MSATSTRPCSSGRSTTRATRSATTRTRDGLAYQANYTSGLRIVDLANVATAALTEVAFYDTYPEDDAFDDGTARARPHPGLPPIRQQATFEGAWSNYPYFASGAIVVSDMKRGLFVVRRTP
jgi:hypothetical protein